MPQEISVSYQAVKSKVHKLLDAMVEGSMTEVEVQESMKRWWKLIHHADRPVAQKYLLMVLARSNSGLSAIADGLIPSKQSNPVRESTSDKVLKLQSVGSQTEFTSPVQKASVSH
jgi:hypothetical protein